MANLSSRKDGTGQQIVDILKSLGSKLESKGVSNPECDKLLTQLHLCSKSASGSDLNPLFELKNISVLGTFAFDNASPTTRRIALRCLNNILVLGPQTRQIFVENSYPKKIIELLKSDDADDELLSARLLLLCSVETSLDLVPIFDSDGLAEILNAKITRYTKEGILPTTNPVSACNATLGLLSTLAAKYSSQANRFFESLPPLLKMLEKVPIPSPPLEPPISSLVGCLASIPFQNQSYSTEARPYPDFDLHKLAQILDRGLRSYRKFEMDRAIAPLMGLLLFIAQSAPADIKARLCKLLLPSHSDRSVPLGQGDSLPHRLVKLGTEPMTPKLKELTPALLFELSNKDAKQFLRNVGYGNGIGPLYAMGIPFSQDDVDQEGGKDSDEDSGINPVTGQRHDTEKKPDLPEMTEEEKEREAERLFVLFERLNKNGIISVQNPVAQAVQSGRFEELPDDSDDDDKKA